MSKRAIADDDDGDIFNEDSDDDDDDDVAKLANKKRKADSARAKKTKKPKGSFIDDAAEESGEEGGGDEDEEDEDDDDDNNDYVRDGFVVDEDEEEVRRKTKSTGGLEDSDDDDEMDDSDDDVAPDKGPKKRKAKRVRKVREFDRLADEDLDLIREARGETEQERIDRLESERQEVARRKVVAQSEEELRKGLFYDSAGEDDEPAAKQQRQKQQPRRMVERYDEDGMDDFIDDDIGDQGAILASDRRAAYEDADGAGGVSEAQLNEASEIFGTEYLEFMQNDEQDDDEENLFGRRKYRERGVGVDLGVDSESEDFDDDEDDEDDLFGDDDDDGVGASQKAEAMKLRREKRELARKERRQQKLKAKQEKRKAKLRKAFEPVQLVENFCTDRDDEIRLKDVPERFFDWKVPFHGAPEGDISPEEEEEALWIMNQIPEIRSEYTAPTEDLEKMEEQEKSVVHSIAYALRFMHVEKLEPAFIKRYRKDVITSPAVRESLYAIMDEDAEWENMVNAKAKVDAVLEGITRDMQLVVAAGAQVASLAKLEEALATAEQKLEETALQETDIKSELEGIGPIEEKEGDDDDDDELFGDDDDDNDNNVKKERKESLEKHLKTIQALLEDRSEKVSGLQKQLEIARAQASVNAPDREPALRVAKKINRDHLWNDEDLVEYLAGLTDIRHILDVNIYLGLLKEGNEAIRNKEMPLAGAGADGKAEKSRRSRRLDRDFYRTCVSEGHRDIAYRFLLAPNRAGIKLEEFATRNQFDYARMMPGEDAPHPQNWLAPTIHGKSPQEFANDLVGSGELVLLSSTSTGPDDSEAKDPLRGSRYVAAMELAHEPRIRRHLRSIYRRHAVLTTRPTPKGLDTIDAFHDYYGLHLIKDKPIKEHFPMDENESAERRRGLTPEECNELDAEMKRRERDSCLQYLNILKAEKTGHIHVHVHLPLAEVYDEWYARGDIYNSRDKQDFKVLKDELEKLYFPLDGDSEEWNNERMKVLTQALVSFLLPQFESETRRELREAAVQVAVIDAGESLYNMAMVGPYRPHALNHTENRFLKPTEDLSIVGVCCPADTKEAMYFVSVTEQGELQDHLAIPGGSRVDSQKYREKVVKFLMQNRPAAVLIGTSGGFESSLLSRKMNDLVNEAVQRWENRGIQGEDEDDEEHEARLKEIAKMIPRSLQDDDESLNWTCNVDLIDDSVSQLFGRSVRGNKEFPEHPQNLRIAASIARHAQDPLAELTYAWSVASDTGNFGAELLYINVYPMQQLLPSYMLLRQYERSLCEVVAEVGADCNKACKHSHLHGLLTFIPGLGPRKAANLKQNVTEAGGVVATRRELLEKRLMGPIVYNNAVAFLRIRETEQIYEIGATLHPLDDTRLHPDVYQRNNWAIKIATDALERVEGEGRNKETAALKALRDVMDNSTQEVERRYNVAKELWEDQYGPTFKFAEWDPKVDVPPAYWRDKVEELDLDTFATMIEQQGQGRWLSHLQMIKWEFRLPFVDPRKPMEALTGKRLFRLITGETEQTLRPGKEVTGKVVSNGEFGCRIKLEGDIPAFIPLRNLSDEHVETAEDIVTPGMVVTAVVTEVKVDHTCVDMSLKLEDFRRPLSQWERPSSLPAIDPAFDRISSANIDEKKTKEREARLEAMRLTLSATRLGEDGEDAKKRRRPVARRACTHPAFRNARNDEVNRELKEAGAAMVGEALIRPSTKSPDSLAVHWVVREGTIKIMEVTEEDKDTDASIGNVLKIKDEAYKSIDELLGRFVAPMNDFVEELTNHRKFIDIPEDELDDKLRAEKAKNPQGVFYNVCWMELHPGYASLRFILSNNPGHHPIGISPSGFVWGARTYKSLDLLLNDFKRNPKGISASRRPVPPATRPVAVVPKLEDDGAPRASRWGSKAPAPPVGWGVAQQAQRPPPPPAGDWNAPVAAGWQQAPPPPAGSYGRPPPPASRPPPPGPPPQYQQNPRYQYHQPPAPPGY